MSAAPSAILGECDTITIPTFANLQSSNTRHTVVTISAVDRAPGSICPIERSPKNEARPRVACIGIVASAALAATIGSRASQARAAFGEGGLHGRQNVEHRLLARLRLATSLDRFDGLAKGRGRFEPSGAISLLSARKRVP